MDLPTHKYETEDEAWLWAYRKKDKELVKLLEPGNPDATAIVLLGLMPAEVLTGVVTEVLLSRKRMTKFRAIVAQLSEKHGPDVIKGQVAAQLIGEYHAKRRGDVGTR